ncbi:hypothetical protein CDD83_1313 [Cordyceps sp. RAO-2017]|nr:hypothetical protein CDD83_1313 [Cordyceps sp. RAO-2017]
MSDGVDPCFCMSILSGFKTGSGVDTLRADSGPVVRCEGSRMHDDDFNSVSGTGRALPDVTGWTTYSVPRLSLSTRSAGRQARCYVPRTGRNEASGRPAIGAPSPGLVG